jgi:hypothetical protein
MANPQDALMTWGQIRNGLRLWLAKPPLAALLDSGVTKCPALQHKLVILVVHCSTP